MKQIPKVHRPKWPKITWTSFNRPLQKKPENGPRVLGIAPWIHDFAAYNLWSRPLGLLTCLTMLGQAGAGVALLDCMEQTCADMPWPEPKPFGQGHFPKKAIPSFPGVPGDRRYSRYGLEYGRVKEALSKLSPPPDCILVTSIMTYWYPGAVEAMELAKTLWPDVPVVLGGVYPTLCRQHALSLELADLVISGPLEERENWEAFWKILDSSPPPLPRKAGMHFFHSLYTKPAFAPLLGSRGCPYSCEYCASRLLSPVYQPGTAMDVYEQCKNEFERGVRDFAFYDDALLFDPETWLNPFLDAVIRDNLHIRLHTPNALHVRYLSHEVCTRLKNAGLITIRLGLETAGFSRRLDTKLTEEEWKRGALNLTQSGFDPDHIGAYILFGLPDQDPEEVIQAIRLVKSHGFRPHLAHYSPIPGTKLFSRASEVSPYPLSSDPLYHNPSLWPCHPGGFSWKESRRWKKLVADMD